MEPFGNHGREDSDMPVNFTLKNVPDDVFEKVRAGAARHRRSINGEIVSILSDALRSRRVDPNEMLARARELRAKTRDPGIDDAFLRAAKGEGRP